ncbi:MAG: hypothetical protein U0869_24135 [Chloroflexota bacterium]
MAASRDVVLAVATEILGPVLSDLGYRGGRGSWKRGAGPTPDRVKLQLSPWNGVRPTSEFVVNISSGPSYSGNQPTGRFSCVLGLADLERMRQLRNEVTAKALAMSPTSRMELDGEPYRQGQDVWMNYVDEDDLRRWMTLTAELLPDAIERTHEQIAAMVEQLAKEGHFPTTLG